MFCRPASVSPGEPWNAARSAGRFRYARIPAASRRCSRARYTSRACSSLNPVLLHASVIYRPLIGGGLVGRLNSTGFVELAVGSHDRRPAGSARVWPCPASGPKGANSFSTGQQLRRPIWSANREQAPCCSCAFPLRLHFHLTRVSSC